MKNKVITLAVLKEARIDEYRTPFSPSQISNLLNNFSNLKIIVHPSEKRCFKNEDYLKAGAQITDDLNSSDIIFGVKEVDISALIKDKTYLFFSHTSKVHGKHDIVQYPLSTSFILRVTGMPVTAIFSWTTKIKEKIAILLCINSR